MRPVLVALVGVALLLSADVMAADDPYNYAARWRSRSPEARTAYLQGLNDGMARTFAFACMKWLPENERLQLNSRRIEEVRSLTWLGFEDETLLPVIWDLYRDPANAFIGVSDIAFVASHKLRGADIEEEIRNLRRGAVEWQKSLEKIRKK